MAIKEFFVIIACFSVLCGFGDSVNIECTYVYTMYFSGGSFYQCKFHNTLNITSRESAVINSNTGSHWNGMNNVNVTGFYTSGSFHVIEYFPRNLENIFTNLEKISINHGRLKEIEQNDLKPFSKLVRLDLEHNDIALLEDGLFAFNPELAHANFSDNKIIHIGSQVFGHLNKLITLYLRNNTCINMDAENNQTALRIVISEIKAECINNEYLQIDSELKMLEINLASVNSDGFPIFQQNLKMLQNKFQYSRVVQSRSLKERIEALKDVKMDSYGLNDRISTIEGSITNLTSMIQMNMEKTSTTKDYFKIVLIGSCAIMFLINIVLLFIYKKIMTE